MYIYTLCTLFSLYLLQRILKQYIRPCNSNKAKLKSKKRPLLSNGNSILGADVLYKVAVTTGNVKNAGSLAKV